MLRPLLTCTLSCLLAFCGTSALLHAQEDDGAAETELARVQRDQSRIGLRIGSLREKMERLAQRYDDEGRTHNATLLREALKEFDAKSVLSVSHELERSLQQSNLSSVEQQDALVTSLEQIYAVLRDRKDADELQRQSDMARKAVEELSYLAKNQRRLLSATRATTDRPSGLLKEALELAAKLSEALKATQGATQSAQSAEQALGDSALADQIAQQQRALSEEAAPTSQTEALLEQALALLRERLAKPAEGGAAQVPVADELLAAAQASRDSASASAEAAAQAMAGAREELERAESGKPSSGQRPTGETSGSQAAGEPPAAVPSGEKSGGEKASGDKSGGGKPSGEKPAGDKAAGSNSAGDKAAGDKSSGDKAAGDKAAGDKAAGDKAAGDKATGEKSAGENAAGEKSAAEKASGNQASGGQQGGEKSAGDQASGEKPTAAKPAGDKAASPSKPGAEGASPSKPESSPPPPADGQTPADTLQAARDAMREATAALEKTRDELERSERSVAAARNRARALALASSQEAADKGTDMQDLAQRLEAVEPDAGPEMLDRTRKLLEELQKLAASVDRGDLSGASDQQKAARTSLDELIKQLQARAKQTPDTGDRKPDPKELAGLAQQQQELQRQVNELMQRLSDLPDKDYKEPTERASKSMGGAESALRSGDTGEAAVREEEAAENLEQAQKKLSGEQDKYEQLRQEEVLFRLGEELKSLLDRHDAISAETLELDKGRGESERLGRSQRRAASRLSAQERDLSVQAETLRAAVDKDGSVAFTFALERCREDLLSAADLLADEQTGFLIQSVQQDIHQRLTDLLAVLDAERERRRNAKTEEPPPGAPDQQTKDQLVPTVAELLLIQRMEQAALARLENFERLNPRLGEEDGVDPVARELLERWALEHTKVTEMFHAMIPSEGGAHAPAPPPKAVPPEGGAPEPGPGQAPKPEKKP